MTNESDLHKTLYPIGLVDGRELRVEDMSVPLHGPSAQYSITLFEGIMGYPVDGGIGVLALREHFLRMLNGAMEVDLGFDRDADVLENLIEQGMMALPALLRRNAVTGTVYIRPTLYHQGNGNVCLGPALNGEIHLGIYLQKWDGYLAPKPAGLKVLLSPYVKASSPVAHLKCSANYGLAIPAKRRAVQLGYDETIFIDDRSRVAEASSQNLLVDYGDRVVTPRLVNKRGQASPILPGITLKILMEYVGPSVGVNITEEIVHPDDILGRKCRGLALCGTASEVKRVGRLDWTAGKASNVFDEPSEAITKLIEGYARLTRGEAFSELLTVVSL